ncbi:hypothetical protein PQX77_017512 [Marasmius sp. AFHP31]|nr:hypothetical protein PQX77_017512 [Marasmius sp. AFHP31]
MRNSNLHDHPRKKTTLTPLLVPRKIATKDVRQRLPQQPQPLAISSSSHTYRDLSRRSVPHKVSNIATSQLYDGFYPLNEKLRALMGKSLPQPIRLS